MSRPYSSFVVRCWRLPGDGWRIKVEHMQSGVVAQVASLEEAQAWMATQNALLPSRTDASHAIPESESPPG
jgi:hypothetical protein